jgi:hypothetical protein
VLRTKQDAEDFVRGACLFGTGGGGSKKEGFELLSAAIARAPLTWDDVETLPADAWTCCAFGMGSIAPVANSHAETPFGLRTKVWTNPLVSAIQELEKFAGVKISVVIPFELGGKNTALACNAAAFLGLKIVDGDYAGRAVPELAQSLPAVHGVAAYPFVIVDSWGNTMIVKHAATNAAAEAIGKMVSIVTKAPDSTATCGHAAFLLKVSEARRYVIRGTLSRALHAGQAIRSARERGEDPVEVLCKAMSGRRVFQGTVVRKTWANSEGYMIGTTEITGTGQYRGSLLKVWFKNENHIAWLDDVPVVTSPDLISIVDVRTGEPYTNTELQEGMEVAVIGFFNEAFANERGIEALGPKHFGFDIPYKSITAK